MYAQELPVDLCLPEAAGGEAASLAALFTWFTQARWSARAVARRLGEVVEARETLDATHRVAWLQGLRRCVLHHGWGLDGATLDGLLTLAVAWSDWQLAVRVGRLLEGRGPLSPHQEQVLVEALANSGEYEEALDCCVSRMLAAPGDDRAPLRYREILERREEVVAADDELILARLAPRHLAEFAWQYVDPEIADLCNLPWFEDADEWQRWLADARSQEHEITLAVLQREWGFIGVVNLFLRRDLGFFYYWVGRDFRGRGWGPRAAGLLLETAEQEWGMRGCLAQAFEHNHASRVGLGKLGFREVDLTVHGGRGRKVLHFRGPEVGPTVLRENARRLFTDMESEERVVEAWNGFEECCTAGEGR